VPLGTGEEPPNAEPLGPLLASWQASVAGFELMLGGILLYHDS
jgi:hypothetical protein